MVTLDTRNRPLRDLRISLIDRCNFRCPYCMPAELFTEDYQFIDSSIRLNAEEITRLTKVMVGLGVEKIRLTGGEPLLRKDLESIVSGVSAVEGLKDLALTTNGVLLAKRAQALRAAGLRRVTVSLDSVDPATFARMSGGRGDLAAALGGIEAAIAAGLEPVKINAVVQKGVNDDGVLKLLEHFRGTSVVVRLIEYMDVGTRNGWLKAEVVPSVDLKTQIHRRWPLEPLDAHYPGEVARRFRYLDGQGEVGLISSVSQPFCGDCNRARLSSDGTLYTCLFASHGAPLRSLVRGNTSDEELADAIATIWRRRADRYSEIRSAQQSSPEVGEDSKVEMYRIGG
ncbi:MAG: GTP 3',8-cyclase MoaA [Lysobacterales bacterium]